MIFMIDPVDIHDAISESFANIERVMRQERAKISDILRQVIVDEEAKPCSTCEHYSTAVQRCLLVSCEYKPARVAWIDIPDPCKHCSTHPSNGGSGNCNCTLGTPKIDCSWK